MQSMARPSTVLKTIMDMVLESLLEQISFTHPRVKIRIVFFVMCIRSQVCKQTQSQGFSLFNLGEAGKVLGSRLALKYRNTNEAVAPCMYALICPSQYLMVLRVLVLTES